MGEAIISRRGNPKGIQDLTHYKTYDEARHGNYTYDPYRLPFPSGIINSWSDVAYVAVSTGSDSDSYWAIYEFDGSVGTFIVGHPSIVGSTLYLRDSGEANAENKVLCCSFSKLGANHFTLFYR